LCEQGDFRGVSLTMSRSRRMTFLIIFSLDFTA
jgi:hypothetical protein